MINKDLKRQIAEYRKRGWRVEMTQRCHFHWYAPDGKTVIVSGGTFSDHRSFKNHTATLKRIEREIAKGSV